MSQEFYARLQLLPEFSPGVIELLKSQSVLVIGAGGLGCPVLQCLNGIPIGKIGILDGDTISETNLARQFLFKKSDVGLKKALIARDRLEKSGSTTEYLSFAENLSHQNAISYISEFDIVMDCTDNFATRYLINDACFILNKPLVYGAVHTFEGTISVFHYKNGPTLRCLYPNEPQGHEIKGCNENGIIPTVTNWVGSIMAQEAVKILTGIGKSISGKMLSVDTLNYSSESFSIPKGDFSKYPQEILETNYPSLSCEPISVNEITVLQLAEWKNSGKRFEIIDVREPYEVEICNLGGINIPLNQIINRFSEIPVDLPVVFLCHHGVRSEMAIEDLLTKRSFSNLFNLIGGIHEWSIQIEPTMSKY